MMPDLSARLATLARHREAKTASPEEVALIGEAEAAAAELAVIQARLSAQIAEWRMYAEDQETHVMWRHCRTACAAELEWILSLPSLPTGEVHT